MSIDPEIRYYILVGDVRNWTTALENKVWGFTPNAKGFWNTVKEGDLLAFYATLPVKKIFGFGKVSEKFVDDRVLWNDEKIFKRVLWPYRIRFKILFLQEDWEKGEQVPSGIILRSPRVRIDEQLFYKILQQTEKKSNIQIIKRSHHVDNVS